MRIADQLRFAFPSQTRARGEAIHGRGDVEDVFLGERSAEATVHGSRPYAVSVDFLPEEGRLSWDCACPAAQDYGPCKHLYAVLLTIDAAREAAPHELSPGGGRSRAPETPLWRRRLDEAARVEPARDPFEGLGDPSERLEVTLEVETSSHADAVHVRRWRRRQKANGRWGRRYPVRTERPDWDEPFGAREIELVAGIERAMRAEAAFSRWSPYRRSYGGDPDEDPLRDEVAGELLERLAAAGVLHRSTADGAPSPLAFDDGPAWAFGLRLAEAKGETLRLEGFLARGEEKRPLAEAALVLADAGLVLEGSTVARFDARGADWWVMLLLTDGPIDIPAAARDEAVERVLAAPGRPLLELPGVRVREDVAPRGCLRVEARVGQWFPCRIHFRYGERESEFAAEGPDLLRAPAADAEVVVRDPSAERALLERFFAAGGGRGPRTRRFPHPVAVAAKRLPALVDALLGDGWLVEVEGRLKRPATGLSLSVRSGIDWFDLEGGVDFDGQLAPLPALLQALHDGQGAVTLGDGSTGVLPADLMRQLGLVAALGKVEGDAVRYAASQGVLLDVLLAGREVEADRDFAALREKLAAGVRIRPRKVPGDFQGELRGYQREGLGWFASLRELGVGGCLADDMGLGKTVQVLAMLLSRRHQGPSLVVAPRSVVFNWVREAERFAPTLRVLDYTGPDRHASREAFGDHDLVVTTYGTLRRDAVALAERTFDYVVLDEAQAIKNASSQTAKSARLLQASHRLALTGTPIENRLGDLWSLFEFLDPGLLGRAATFRRAVDAMEDDDTLVRLARALRPFVLRRTKDQVLADLPPKSEQLLVCDMQPAQRKAYEGVRDRVRSELLGAAPENGKPVSKLHVLEALLRLRQIACHPALIDPKREGEPSAKLDALVPLLEEIRAEGHKALVFSQFTRFLSLVRTRLDAAGIACAYMDGRTRNRSERIDRFQQDPDTTVFLISLKAGGFGLNLTAADYVFLLDPWWNPAVERQAVDRSHRIGQTRPVHVYRLLCRGTVEEKVLELQARKRQVAETVLSASEGGSVRGLSAEDLDLLLS